MTTERKLNAEGIVKENPAGFGGLLGVMARKRKEPKIVIPSFHKHLSHILSMSGTVLDPRKMVMNKI